MTAAVTFLRSIAISESGARAVVKPAETAANDPIARAAATVSTVPPIQVSRVFACRIAAPMLGLVQFRALWAAVSQLGQSLPGPLKTWHSAVEVFRVPSDRNGPNDQGIGWNVLASLQRIGIVGLMLERILLLVAR